MRTWNAEIELNSSTRGKRHYIPTKNHMSTTNQSPTYYTSLANPQQKQSNPPRPQPRISKHMPGKTRMSSGVPRRPGADRRAGSRSRGCGRGAAGLFLLALGQRGAAA